MKVPSFALLGCPECDLLQRPTPVAAGQAALCSRCGAKLYRAPRPGPDRMLPLALAGLVALGVAIAFPIVGLEIKGTQTQTTLIGAALALYENHMPPLAALVIATTVVYPLLALSAMALLKHRAARHAPALLRALRAIHPWCMVEVFVLGLLVAYAKLAHMTTVAPGPGAWALGAFIVLWAVTQREVTL